jgi:hypothetical protein
MIMSLRKRFRVWWLLLLIPLVIVVSYAAWARAQYRPTPAALAALESDERVEVQQGNGARGGRWLLFRPTETKPRTALVFYPGGFVDPRAYAPAARDIAAQGYLVIIVPMPLNLAVLASIYGTLDALATPAEIDASRSLLPPDARWTAIEGANHAQFGSYGPQAGDHQAAISAEAQQARTVVATVVLLADLEGQTSGRAVPRSLGGHMIAS